MFLSFSKNKNIAKGFLHEGNEELIPVLFEVEKINEKDIKNIKNNNKDFFISNLDLKNITEYEEEEEVLFLPFSCFEIVSIKDESIKLFGKDINIKKITLNYLHKYRNSLYKYISEIKEKEKFENFLKQVINSGFSSEIAQLINFDMDKEFRNFINQKFQFKKNFLNFKPIQNFKFMSSQLYAQTAFNKLFPEAPKSIQKILIEGKEALLVILEDGLNILLTYSENKVFYRRVKEIKDYITVKKLDLNSINNGEIAHKALKTCNECNVSKNDNFCDNCIKKVEHRNQKGNIEQSNYFEFFSVGLVIGDFIANYESIKDEPLITQLKSLSGAAISCLAPFLPKIFSTFLPKAIVSKVPILMASISSIEFIISLKEIKSDKSLSRSETNSLIFKKVLSFIGEIGVSILVGKIGFKILLFLNVGPGIIVGVAAIGIGIATGYAISKIKNKFEDSKNLSLFSDSLYYQYIPKKFREYCIPTLCWNGVKNAKSFAIELVEDGIRKWLVINIKKWIRKIDNENYFDVGDTIVEYSGISKHPFKVTFILYELKKERFKPEEWGVGENIKEDYSEELSKYFIQVAVLDVF